MTKFHTIFSVVALVALFALGSSANAQTQRPNILLSWSANTYTPAEFPGRALPTGGSTIALGLDVISGGRSANLAPYKIIWEQNSSRVASGKGLDQIEITTPNISGRGIITVRAQIEDFRGESLAKTVTIPVSPPRVSIRGPEKQNNTYTLEAVPYFFDISRLSQLAFQWDINGQAPSSPEHPRFLDVTIDPTTPIGAQVSVSLSATNTTNQAQQAVAGTTFIHR